MIKREWASVLLAISVGILFSSVTVVFSPNFVGAAGTDGCSVNVYIVSLADVDNHVATNNSRIIDGALDASDIDEVIVSLDIGKGNYSNVQVNVSADIVTSWDVYRELVESYSSVIIVNTHDEWLPVPDGYSKEEWVGKIADFMMNRWGTWAHVGGYPFYYVQYENGLVETWGEEGFQTLMSHIGKDNVNCNPPEGKENRKATVDIEAFQQIGINWPMLCVTYKKANVGKPLKFSDFKEYFVVWLHSSTWEGETHLSNTLIKFMSKNGTSNLGIYVHLGSWRFFDTKDHESDSDFAMGYISTASAIWSQIAWSSRLIFAASKAAHQAQNEGRTSGLQRAWSLLQQAADAYNQGNYNKASLYAEQAKDYAENATRGFLSRFWPYITLFSAITIIVGAYGAYKKLNNKG